MIKRLMASLVCLTFIFTDLPYAHSQDPQILESSGDPNFKNIMAQSNAALMLWFHYNVYPEFGIPKSFEVPKDPKEAKEFFSKIGDDTSGFPGFFVDEFQEHSAMDLIQTINKSGISVPQGSDDRDRLNNLLKTRDLHRKLLNLQLPRQVADLIRGIVPKHTFFRVDSRGPMIIDSLIKKGVLKEVSPTAVRLIQGKPISRPPEITGNANWDEIWVLLQLSLNHEAQLTENELMRSNRELLEQVYPPICPVHDLTGIIERYIINDGLSIYEGGAWQIALAMAPSQYNFEISDRYTDMLDSGHFGSMEDIRAWQMPYTYEGKLLPKRNSFFFRLISPRFLQHDPLTGLTVKLGFPSYDRLHWSDWMPVLGEQSWTIMGLLQIAYAKGHGKADPDSKEVKLAESIVPAIKALRTMTGAVFFCPAGVWDHPPIIISTENNASFNGALWMLYAVTKDPQYLELIRGVENYFKNYAWDKENQRLKVGGVIVKGKFLPPEDVFALDCQTWPILSFSPAKLDGWFGEGSSYRMWKNAKKKVGYYEDGEIRGVGFTDNSVQSSEWTWGAIGATNELALYYWKSHPDWARECLADSISMLKGEEELKHIDKDGHKSYYYANKRYFIMWGWWANPTPNLASTAWAYLIQNGYNPFKLGEKTRWFTLPGLQAAVEKYQGAPLYKTNVPPIKGEGNGVGLPLSQWPLKRANVQGFVPHLISVQPVDRSTMLGLNPQKDKERN